MNGFVIFCECIFKMLCLYMYRLSICLEEQFFYTSSARLYSLKYSFAVPRTVLVIRLLEILIDYLGLVAHCIVAT